MSLHEGVHLNAAGTFRLVQQKPRVFLSKTETGSHSSPTSTHKSVCALLSDVCLVSKCQLKLVLPFCVCAQTGLSVGQLWRGAKKKKKLYLVFGCHFCCAELCFRMLSSQSCKLAKKWPRGTRGSGKRESWSLGLVCLWCEYINLRWDFAVPSTGQVTWCYPLEGKKPLPGAMKNDTVWLWVILCVTPLRSFSWSFPFPLYTWKQYGFVQTT